MNNKDFKEKVSDSCYKASLVAQMVKNPPASTRDTGDAGSIPGLGKFLQKERATLSSILDWKIP